MAYAQDRDPTREALRQGRTLYEAGRYEEALAAFQAAYDQRPLPRFLSLMCQTQLQLRRPKEAIRLCQRYLEEDPDITEDERRKTAGFIATAQELLDKERRPASAAPPKLAPVLISPPQPMARTRAPRPRWRIATGAVLSGAGVGLMGFGIPALVIDDTCADEPASQFSCSHVYRSQPLGLGLTLGGVAVGLAGVVLLALPGERRRALAATATAGRAQRGGVP